MGLMTGCATVAASIPTTAPAAEPSPVHPHTYGRDIAPPDKMLREIAERVRRIDPCALIPESVVAPYGEVRQFGPQTRLDSCTAVVHPTGGNPLDELTVAVELSPPSGDEGERVSGFGRNEVYRVHDTHGRTSQCTLRFAFTVPVTVAVDGAPPTRFGTVEAQHRRAEDSAAPGADVCEIAGDTLRVTLARIPSLPARPGTGPGRIRLAAADPCEVIGGLEETELLHWHIDSAPYRCAFRTLTADGGPTTWSVSFGLEPEYMLVDGDHAQEVKFDGRSLFVRGGDGYCRVAAPVAEVVDTNRPGVAEHSKPSGRNVPTVVLSSDTAECDRLVPLAADLADLAVT
ncbi:hypothetical protein [Rhodococcus chondri]|uniref:Secreted protein n=1 Tax=Rhodococcus chondri TaxID=3065941 RepID=A0ABU7JNK9_9NOCA|nr:hypothetical protein [Rhodococcus sp. CC-R104]MEE2031624.1 hypothetical protein [Rhodococcus sp. CC-R104]